MIILKRVAVHSSLALVLSQASDPVVLSQASDPAESDLTSVSTRTSIVTDSTGPTTPPQSDETLTSVRDTRPALSLTGELGSLELWPTADVPSQQTAACQKDPSPLQASP